MSNIKKLFVFFLIFFVLMGCSSAQIRQDPPTEVYESIGDPGFEFNELEIGKIIVGMKLVSLEPRAVGSPLGENNFIATFSGEKKLVGTQSDFEAGYCFIPNGEYQNALPFFKNGSYGMYFCFSNEDFAKKTFAAKKVGYNNVEIVIDQFVISSSGSKDDVARARLKSVGGK